MAISIVARDAFNTDVLNSLALQLQEMQVFSTRDVEEILDFAQLTLTDTSDDVVAVSPTEVATLLLHDSVMLLGRLKNNLLL